MNHSNLLLQGFNEDHANGFNEDHANGDDLHWYVSTTLPNLLISKHLCYQPKIK